MKEPTRFQVNKRVAAAIRRRHPWIFSRQCSSALQAISGGSVLRLVGTQNEFLGYGLYEPLGAIAIRIFSFQGRPIDAAFFEEVLLKAYERRKPFLEKYQTDAFRWVHGESDSLPGLTIDVYGETAIVLPHLQGWLPLLREPLPVSASKLNIKNIYLKRPRSAKLCEWSSGNAATPEEPIWFRERGRRYSAFPVSSLKTGFFLDLREVRLWLENHITAGTSLLNLFAGDGALSALALALGAGQVLSVERSPQAPERARLLFRAWQIPFQDESWMTADVWDFVAHTPATPRFHLAIIDPPSLGTAKNHLPAIRRAWVALHAETFTRMLPRAQVVSISCTERLTPDRQWAWTCQAAQKAGRKIERSAILPGNFDHPDLKTLKERNYFRAWIWHVC